MSRRPVKLVPAKRSPEQVLADRRIAPGIAKDLAEPLTRETIKAYHFYLEENNGENPFGFPPEIKLGVSMPKENEVEIFCEFTRYLMIVTEGLLGEFACRSTIIHYTWTLYSVFRRVLYYVDQTTRGAVSDYIDSDRVRRSTPLTTAAREKYSLATDDAIILGRLIWEDTTLFRNTRMRAQTHHAFQLQNLSSERPGAILQAARYKPSKKNIKDKTVAEAPLSLCWNDYTFRLIPNPHTPTSPYLIVQVRIRLLKCYRKDDSKFKHFCLFMDINELRAHCALSSLLYMAFEDDIFKNVHSIEEILHPVNPPTTCITLQLRDEVRQLPVLRAEYFDGKNWRVSSTEPLGYPKYATILKKLGEDAGFENPVTPYTSRRGTGNRMSVELSESDRNLLMGHTELSRAFVNSYQSRTFTGDLGSLLFNRPENSEYTALAKSLKSMSTGRHRDAPKFASLQDRAQVLNMPELQTLDRQREKLLEDVSVLKRKLVDCPEDGLAIQSEIDDKTAQHVSLRKQRYNIERRSLKPLAANNHQDHFANQDTVQLIKPFVPSTFMRPATRGKENPPSDLPIVMSAQAAFILEFLENISDVPVADSVIAFVNALKALPVSKLVTCYPGEYPTIDGNCPECGEAPKKRVALPNHIHQCIFKRKIKEARETADADYEPSQCLWDGCTKPDKIFESRSQFLKHINRHTDYSLLKSGICKWKLDGSGKACNSDPKDYWENHFAQHHDISLVLSRVNYCVVDGEWFTDDIGDGSAWEEHCAAHIDAEFAAFMERPDDPVDLTPKEIAIIDNRFVEFTLGSGFGDRQPNLHGHYVDGLVLEPFRCPFCLFDEDALDSARYFQFMHLDKFIAHLRQHVEDVDDTTLCPVPSCGHHEFTRKDLVLHLIKFHRLPVAGSTGHTLVRRLRLPKTDDQDMDVDEDNVIDVDLMAIDVDSASKPSEEKAMDEDEDDGATLATSSKSAHRARAKKPTARALFHCFGCRNSIKDIVKHLNSAKPGSLCQARGKYQCKGLDGSRIGEVIHHEFSQSDATAIRPNVKKNVQHYCPCGSAFVDIREHLPDNCPRNCKSFKIRGLKGRARNGELVNFAEWLKTVDT